MSAELRILKMNFRETGDTSRLNLTPDSVPTLSPQAAINEFMAGDDNPYYKIEAINYPIKANGWNYKESFFESYIGKLNDRVIPGSKHGHSMDWGARPTTDFLVVGGKMEKNGDGTGVAYLKNYIPKSAESDNSAFIKENKANLVHFSIVSYTKDEIIDNGDGSREYNVIESMYGERNDAVEYDMGGMDQKTNGKSGGEPPENSEVDMTKEEALTLLKNLLDNGKMNVKDIASEFGLEIVGDVHRNNADLLKKLNGILGEDPVAKANEMIAERKANAEKLINSKLDAAFGEAGTDEEPNLIRQHANSLLPGLDSELSIEEKINAIKENPITKKLNAQKIDPYAGGDTFGTHDKKTNSSGVRAGRMTL